MTGAGLAVALGAALAAGTVVDVTGGTEARGAFVATDGGTEGVYSLVATPRVQAAVEREGAAGELAYAPQLSLVVPSQNLVLLLHSGSAGAEVPLNRRLRVRARAFGAIGDLDPGTAQRELFSSLGVLDREQALSFATGTFEGALVARLTPAATLEVIGNVVGTGSPFSTASEETTVLRSVHTESLGVRNTLNLSRLDALLLDASLRAATIIDGGKRGDATALGVFAAAGYRRQLVRGAALEARAGGLVAVADAGDGRGRNVVILPAFDARLGASLDLGSGSALDGELSAGLVPLTDPLGALLEDRLIASATGGIRFQRDASLRASVFLAAPLFAFGGTTVALAGTGASATFSWAFVRDAALQVGALSQTRLLPAEPGGTRTISVEATVLCGVAGTFTAFHSGSRPRGSDSRPGRDIGAPGIGRAPPPQQQQLESERELPPLEEPEPETLPPELVPPPVQMPIEFVPDRPRQKRKSPASGSTPATPSSDDEVSPRRGSGGAGDSAGKSDSKDDGGTSRESSSEKKP